MTFFPTSGRSLLGNFNAALGTDGDCARSAAQTLRRNESVLRFGDRFHNFASGNIDHALRPLIEIARAFGGFRHDDRPGYL